MAGVGSGAGQAAAGRTRARHKRRRRAGDAGRLRRRTQDGLLVCGEALTMKTVLIARR